MLRFCSCFALALVVLGALGCSDDTTTQGNGAGGAGAGSANGGAGGTGAGFGEGGSGAGNNVECEVPCEDGQICSHGTCVDQQSCNDDDDCDFDTYCNEATMLCEPWEGADPGSDETCSLVAVPGLLSPKVRCEFSSAPANDPFPGHVDVQGTPVVVNFHKPADSGPPSIAASFTATVVGNYTEDLGVIRVLSGEDCSLEANLGGTDLDGDAIADYTVSSASLAVADLDGDAVAEIVAYGADGSTLAFKNTAGTWGLLWKSPYPAGAPWLPCNPDNHRCGLGWAGPSIHDIDGDGSPEIIREGVVFSSTGALVSGPPPSYVSYGSGLFPVLANLDADDAVELTNGQFVWEWLGGVWTLEPAFPGGSASAPGHAAVADFGDFGSGAADDAEIAVVRSSSVMVYALDGTLAMPPVAVPGAGGGGPPTISDFDGDGLAEVGVAGQAFYTVYDIDCGPTPRPGGTCNPGTCDFAGAACAAGSFMLWSHSTQDISSNVTGSSIFDFEADGKSEVVYGDECFTRVYDGQSGDVLFSQYRSSCTWYENPIIADVDGNFRADLVTPSNKACSPDGSGIACQTLNADGVDPQWNGVRCEDAGDCVSGVCDQGLCRCTASAECCALADDAACIEAGLKCAAPNAGTPGMGNTCRASHPHGVSGIRVYSDANDKWVRSRTIWSQHAYHVTHIEENGTVPPTAMWEKNWLDPELNNFRQNVPGNSNGSAIPDPTAGANDFDSCDGADAVLSVDICNRGAAPQGAGIVIGFYVDGEKVCETATEGALDPEECETVTCIWADPPTTEMTAVDVDVVANDGQGASECHEGNNLGVVKGVYCEPPS
ncbi:MAG: VCBS repeat-containing protein [Polyangiaceae bacterium]|nr:VCBS repeat-containing protein [Polyangiaceae bacterium]